MKRKLRNWVVAVALLVTIGGGIPVARSQHQPTIQALDVYGTDALNAEEIAQTSRKDLDALAAAIAARDRGRVQAAKAAIADRVRSRGDFAYVEISVIQYFPPTPGLYATIDVVEAKDRGRRMPFRTPPTGSHDDPGGLIAAWDEYMGKVTALAAKGEAAGPAGCPVLHCLVSFAHPDLQPFLSHFNAGVAMHEKALFEIARLEADSHRRATALFLLGHSPNASALMPLLGESIFDADSEVRNNGMRVMIGIAGKGLRVEYPMMDIIAALDFPTTTDRNKAVAVTATVIDKFPEQRGVVLEHALPALLRLLRLQQPNNHDFAYMALKTLSGKDLGARAYDEWAAWAADIKLKATSRAAAKPTSHLALPMDRDIEFLHPPQEAGRGPVFSGTAMLDVCSN